MAIGTGDEAILAADCRQDLSDAFLWQRAEIWTLLSGNAADVFFERHLLQKSGSNFGPVICSDACLIAVLVSHPYRIVFNALLPGIGLSRRCPSPKVVFGHPAVRKTEHKEGAETFVPPSSGGGIDVPRLPWASGVKVWMTVELFSCAARKREFRYSYPYPRWWCHCCKACLQ
jgi:hypothetical protein